MNLSGTLFANHTLPRLHYASSLHWNAGEKYNRSLHNHPDWVEFLLITKGTGTCVVRGESYHFEPGCLVVYNRGEWHEEYTDASRPREILCFACSNLYIQGLPPGTFLSPHVPLVLPIGSHFEIVKQRFHTMLAEAHKESPQATQIADYMLAIVLTELAGAIDQTPIHPQISKSIRAVAQAQHYIHSHYAEDITLRELSRTTFLSPFHLSRIFKSKTGYSPIQYLIHYRMEVAKRYLLTTSDTIDEIAHRVGYTSSPHFQNTFRKFTGMTAGQYRKCGKLHTMKQ